MVRRPFVRGNIASRHPDRVVKRRIPGPGLQHPAIKIVAIHFCTNQVPIDLFGHRPLVYGKSVQTLTKVQVIIMTPFEALATVIGSAIEHWRRFKCAPVGKQLDKIIVIAANLCTERRNRQHDSDDDAKPGRPGYSYSHCVYRL